MVVVSDNAARRPGGIGRIRARRGLQAEAERSPQEEPQRRSWHATLVGVPRAHAAFCSVLLLAIIVRVVAMLGYRPALWTSDSLRYVALASHLAPYEIQPVGYPALLRLLRPFHSLTLVAGVQHAMGLATGTAVYVLLRKRCRFPAWAATLAAVPPLLSIYAIQIEHFLLSDTPFTFLVTIAIVLMLWTPLPRVWTCALVGLLLAAAVLVRSQGTLLAIPFIVYLGARLASRSTFAGISRRLAAGKIVAGLLSMVIILAVPVLAYARWFERAHGSLQITTSTGAYLYSRVAPFADCAVIKPPADERWLCLSTPVSQRQHPGYYLWQPGSPLHHGPYPEFGVTVDRLATGFALRAIEAQPTDYLRAVWHSTIESFTPHRDLLGTGQSQYWYSFPLHTPQSVASYAHVDPSSPVHSDYSYEHRDPSTRVVLPYVYLIRGYQNAIKLPGPVLGVIVLAGLLGMAVAWRRFGGQALLPWLTGVTLIVTPAATVDFDARYLVSSVPAFCIAAAIGIKELTSIAAPRGRGEDQQPRADEPPGEGKQRDEGDRPGESARAREGAQPVESDELGERERPEEVVPSDAS